MRAELKSLVTIEHDVLENYQPADGSHFGVWARMMIGPLDGKGQESFDLLICTPSWLEHMLEKDKCVWGRHKLIVSEWNFEAIKESILKYIRFWEEDNWDSLANKLARAAHWEFEDYKA